MIPRKLKTIAALLFLFVWLSILGGCMSVSITAREGSTVNVDQQKPVTTTTDASIPEKAIGAI
jgi:hypothetical protein